MHNPRHRGNDQILPCELLKLIQYNLFAHGALHYIIYATMIDEKHGGDDISGCQV